MKKMKFFFVLLLTYIFNSESLQFLKFIRPNEPEPYQRYRSALHHSSSAMKIKNEKKYSTPTIQVPEGIHHSKNPYDDSFFLSFLKDYEENFEFLNTIDPCIFSPCGANTMCFKKHRHSSRGSSKVCYCHKGFIPHPRISETCVRPCDLHFCGPNASCTNDVVGIHNCVCNPGYLPILHGTSHFKGCGDPCQSSKCNPLNTICIRKSANERVCLCEEGTVPKNGDAANFGCEAEPVVSDPCKLFPCNPTNTLCIVKSQTNRYCICKEGNIAVGGDAVVNGCMPNPCSVPNACGEKTFCIINNGVKSCICVPGFLPASPGDENTVGCVDPCSVPNACGEKTFCIINNGVKSCICVPGFLPASPGDENTVGCVDPCSGPNACGEKTFCIINNGVKSCICVPGFLPASPGDESTVGCVNPCSNSVCTEQNSVCDPITATQYQCVCNVGFKPIQNDAEKFGCHQDCGTAVNAIYIVEKNYCLELFPYLANLENFADARGICQGFGGDLAVFDETDATLENLLIKYFPSLLTPSLGQPNPFYDDLFIGGESVNGAFQWIDGTTLTGVTGTTGTGRVAVLLAPVNGGLINVASSPDTRERGFICQYNRP